MAFIFLSYERKDSETARIIADALGNAGHTVWWDRHIKGGAQFSKEIERALDRADVVVVLWSASSVDSAWVRDEATTGRDSGRLVPARIDHTPPPLGFRQYQTIDLTGQKSRPSSEGVEALLDTIADLVAVDEQSADAIPRNVGDATTLRARLLTRRSAIVGITSLGVAGAAGFLLLKERPPTTSPEVEALLAQAWQAWFQGTSEGNSQALGLYRRATVLAPDYPDAWGFLGCAYADRAHSWARAAERSALRDRARDAGRQALRLDSKNAYGRAAIAYAQPMRGNWLVMEREFTRALQEQPGKWLITYSLALLFTRVGRLSEAASLFDELRAGASTATQYLWHIHSLWGSGRLEEAERKLQEATEIYGAQRGIWFTRFNMLMLSGNPSAAITHAGDLQRRPSGVTDELLELPIAVATAVLNRNAVDTAALAKASIEYARASTSQAERAIQFTSALGRLDEAFAIAEAYFFSRGFAVPDFEAKAETSVDVSLDTRQTGFLFLPTLKAMRADDRFERLTEEIGLTLYWRQSGAQPDYLRA